MNPRRGLWLAVPALLAAAIDDNDDLIRRGNHAFHHGDFAAAVSLYEKAQARSRTPELVAFNLATANYHLAGNDPTALGAAESAYRSCLEPGDPRRAEALFGLGNCLLLRGSAGKADPLALRAAIDRFSECLRTATGQLAEDARCNRERARLLLAQSPPTAGQEQDGGNEPNDDARDARRDGDRRRGPAGPDPDGGNTDAEEGKGNGDPREGKAAAGRGGLPPVPESADAPPLSRSDAAVHLDRASQRIRDDLKAYRRGRVRSAPPGARDW